MRKRPYEQKTVSRGGLIAFIVGIIAMLAIMTVTMAIFISPNFATRLDNLSYRARGYYHQLFPPPPFLPTPAPISQATAMVQPLKVAAVMASATPMPPSPTLTMTPMMTAATTLPTVTPTPTQLPTATALPKVLLTNITHQWQTWNNCGPTTIAMYLSHFGYTNTQAEAAQFLKPNRDDKNVSPDELVAYAQTSGLQAIMRHGGTLAEVKRFLSQGLPILVETWFNHDGDEMGHYRLITGYDDSTEEVTMFDSFNGPNIKLSYTDFTTNWRVFNYVYVVVYQADQADMVTQIIGADMEDSVINERLVAQAQAEIAANPNDPIAFFNEGDALTRLGRLAEAATAFDQARQLKLHWRRLWYQFTPFEAYYGLGRYQDVIDLSQATIKNSGGLEEAYYYLGLALQATGQPGAAENFQAAIDYNPNFTLARDALAKLGGGN